jgi:hypothetical protein
VVNASNSVEALAKSKIIFSNAVSINVPPEYADLFKPRFVINRVEEDTVPLEKTT